MERRLTLLIICLCALMLTDCRKTDIEPSYIVVTKEDISVLYDEVDQAQFNSLSGLTAHHFTDIWLTVNGEKLGTWELPCKIPVLASGDVTVSMLPGIAMNGMSTTRPEYPFVQSFTQKVSLTKGAETVIQPRFSYYGKTLHFPLVENFESAGTSFANTDTSAHLKIDKVYDSEMIYQNPDDPADHNSCSGLIHLTKETVNTFEIASPTIKLPGGGRSIFLELNYKCDEPIYASLGVIQSTTIPTEESLIVLRATNGAWKKAYINLTLAVSRNLTATGFKILFSGSRNEKETADFYFDNIRVMYLY